ncbi:uncharacterized protein N7459_002802 [Penicillium hispanicum]|uniref:uncharacterized protein n=1 Tax=Penicillium hispanicum TaxID=1080232 RepID=UPI002541B22F|nr:uncharacterized protein N7459_002802 [Penicillium hispanicum]KAJ5587037.1 hypothetical protein N7459_002802 [Penicillium hispanicum]
MKAPTTDQSADLFSKFCREHPATKNVMEKIDLTAVRMRDLNRVQAKLETPEAMEIIRLYKECDGLHTVYRDRFSDLIQSLDTVPGDIRGFINFQVKRVTLPDTDEGWRPTEEPAGDSNDQSKGLKGAGGAGVVPTGHHGDREDSEMTEMEDF